MKEDRTGWLLVAAQFAAIVGLVSPGRRRWRMAWPLAVISGVSVLTGAGITVAGSSRLGRRLRAVPAPPPEAQLRCDGAYGVVRHPIYLGLLLMSSGVALLRARIGSLAALGALATVLQVKIRLEEHLLHEHFGARYAEYCREVPRLLPRWLA